MSEKQRREEQRRLRKAVGEDAMKLMGALVGAFPLIEQHTAQIASLRASVDRLEARVRALSAPEANRPNSIRVQFAPDVQSAGAEVV